MPNTALEPTAVSRPVLRFGVRFTDGFRGRGSAWVVRLLTIMYVLMFIGLVVCAIGKLKLTPTITLVGVRARWYGLTLFATAIPFYWLVRQLYLIALPSLFSRRRFWALEVLASSEAG